MVLFASMVIAGLVVDLLFGALHLIPAGPRPASALSQAHSAWNYTTWLDPLALAVAAFLVATHFRGARAMMHEHHHHCPAPLESLTAWVKHRQRAAARESR